MRIPDFIHRHLENRPGLQKIIANIGWLFADRILRIGVGLFVGVWVARYLGPEQFGLFSYATAFVTLFSPIAGLGLNGIVVRNLVKTPELANETLGTAFVLQLLGSLLALSLAVCVVGYSRPDDVLIQSMVLVLACVLVVKSTEVVKYWFESQVQSKYAVWVENTVVLIFSGVKIALILNHAPLLSFVWAMLTEATLIAVALLGMYVWQSGPVWCWQVRFRRTKALLNDSWPLILSGLSIMLYMRMDQIMIEQMLGAYQLGVYSAAVRLVEATYFIPTAIVASLYPGILSGKSESSDVYHARFQTLYNVMVWVSLPMSLVIFLSSAWLVPVLYGVDYQGAEGVLSILCWSTVFVFLNVSSGKWFISENLTLLALRRNVYGLILNLILNGLLIPVWGVQGAALASLLAYSVTAYFSDAFCSQTRIVFAQKSRAFISLGTETKRLLTMHKF